MPTKNRCLDDRCFARIDVYVIRGLKTNVLGLPGITSLHLLEKLCEVTDEDIQEQYAKVFTGLGNFGNEYDIKLKHPLPFMHPETYPYLLETRFRRS